MRPISRNTGHLPGQPDLEVPEGFPIERNAEIPAYLLKSRSPRIGLLEKLVKWGILLFGTSVAAIGTIRHNNQIQRETAACIDSVYSSHNRTVRRKVQPAFAKIDTAETVAESNDAAKRVLRIQNDLIREFHRGVTDCLKKLDKNSDSAVR